MSTRCIAVGAVAVLMGQLTLFAQDHVTTVPNADKVPDVNERIPTAFEKDAEHAFSQGMDYFIWTATNSPPLVGNGAVFVPYSFASRDGGKPFRIRHAISFRGEFNKSNEISRVTGEADGTGGVKLQDKKSGSATAICLTHYSGFGGTPMWVRGQARITINLVDDHNKQISNDVTIEVTIPQY